MKNNKRTTIKSGRRKTLNIVVVGDADTGKTALMMAFKGKRFDMQYVPTVFDTYTAEIRVKEEEVELGLWDTAGQESYDRLRPLAYPHCHAFVICYAIDSPNSLCNVIGKWLPEVQGFCPNVPKILVATKKDLRQRYVSIMDVWYSNKVPKLLSYDDGLYAAVSIGASRFVETSALHDDGIHEAFQQTARVALYERKKRELGGKTRKESCCIL